LVFTRYPDGIYAKAFYQKQAPKGTPEWIRTCPVAHNTPAKVVQYVVASRAEDLAWTANMACIEVHPWLSRTTSLDNPDFAVFDLDPSEDTTFGDVCDVAFLVRQVLEHYGLRLYIKTTGGSGLHMFLPVAGAWTYEKVQLCVRFVAELARQCYPEKVTLERLVKNRRGKVYIDFLQNAKGKTLVGVFSCRPSRGAPVSFPIAWEELRAVMPASFTLMTARQHIKTRGDAFAGVLSDAQDISRLATDAQNAFSAGHLMR